MSASTLQIKALQLLQKSRQAFRLYSRANDPRAGARSGATRPTPTNSTEDFDLQELQRQEWRNVNAELIRTLGQILDVTSHKHLAQELFHVKESFLLRYRESQATLRQQQEQLIAATERGDFLVIPKIGINLISLKSLGQAQQAALHELESLVNGHRSNDSRSEVSPEERKREGAESSRSTAVRPTAKIIPLRRAGSKYS